MIKLQNVCYVRLGTRDLEGATRFATGILGLEVSEWGRNARHFKSDQREGLIGKSAHSTRDEIIKYEKRLEKARHDITTFQREQNLASVKEVGDALQKQYDDRYKEFQDLATLRQSLGREMSAVVHGQGDVTRRIPHPLYWNVFLINCPLVDLTNT